MEKLPYVPEQDGYTVVPGEESLRSPLKGGAGRYRKDVEGASAFVTVTWELEPSEYENAATFFRGVVASGTTPFLMDLILFNAELTEHTCYFMPGTFILASMQGHKWTTQATLEVIPDEAPDGVDVIGLFAVLVASGGSSLLWLNALEILTNYRFINV